MGKLTCCAVVLTISACGGGGGSTPDASHDSAPPIDAPVETLGPAPALAIACSDSAADVYTLPTGLPAMDDSHRGDVFRCATTESLSQYKVNAQIAAYNVGYPIAEAGAATSGFWTYRIAFRSERNTVNSARAEGDTAAYLLVPEKPLAGAPLVVFGHGSVGIAAKCAPTHLDLAGAVDDQDFPPALLRLAGAGYTVISPDYNGFSYNQPPGYFIAEDEAHAILDATRAAANVLPTPPAKVVFVGHSQGGHAVVAAQGYAASYGHAGTLVGVATFAPFWASLSLFGAATTGTAGLMTANAGDTSSILYPMEYAYSEGELNEGSGHGVDVFQPDKQAAAKDTILGGECYDMAKLQALGATPADFFLSTFVDEVGNSCSLNGNCSTTLSAKWKQYWQNERPPVDPMGAPMLVMFGGMDAFVTPGRAQCVQNKINTDLGSGATATVQYCQNPNAAHRDLVRTSDVDYVISWINARAGIGSDPAACTPPQTRVCPPLPADL
jgi:pimeloyl-ACP methyl ester carboxylesterase